MQTIRLILGTIVTLVVLAWTGVQLYAAYTVHNAMYQVNSSIAEAERASQPPVGNYQVVNVKDDPSLWGGYEALSKVGEPVEDRVVTFTALVRLRDLLQPGEAKPDADFADVFVNARAGTYADGECARLLKKLASYCKVSYANANRSGQGDVYNISATLSFVQKDELGKVEETSRLAYREVNNSMPAASRSVSVMPSDAARQREKFYEEAARLCTKLRKSEGNCAVYRIDISTTNQSGSDALLLSGFTRLSFLQPVKS
jgi:hypothetical protein